VGWKEVINSATGRKKSIVLGRERKKNPEMIKDKERDVCREGHKLRNSEEKKERREPLSFKQRGKPIEDQKEEDPRSDSPVPTTADERDQEEESGGGCQEG